MLSQFCSNGETKNIYSQEVKFAAIDIGSNGARILISRVLLKPKSKTSSLSPKDISFKSIEYLRYPLRLGVDAFGPGVISATKQGRLLKLMKICQLLMDLHEVDDYLAYATSAFRVSSNGQALVNQVRKETGICINVISGQEEAEVLSLAIIPFLDKDKSYLHIDVGGGSTELNLYNGHQRLASKSFPLGSIRNQANRSSQDQKDEMKHWLQNEIKTHCHKAKIIAIGTGGNINKVYSLINPKDRIIRKAEIISLQGYLKNFSFEEKVNILKLNPDRADTIEPASKIYLSAMDWAKSELMIVPKVGLKDGMMEKMLRRNLKKSFIPKA